ncbi:hypothetical protein [Bradyrhizobium sp. Ai1a-2]|uniref:hypothetical protein n=1 Tax=Bradyrhizobium sp. Ai1a-2 TaxID=196490 RepID=UPI00041DF643|nr:hypothetical protein [Bradyrhizobium sp. Ai1a-2]
MALFRNATITQAGITGPFNLDPMLVGLVAVQVVILSPGVNTKYSVEFTLDDLSKSDGTSNLANVRWSTDPQFPVGSNKTITGNYIVPISALRVNVDTIDGATIEFKLRQGMSLN